MSNFSLPKEVRLLKRAEYLKLSRHGRKIRTSYFIAAVSMGTEKNNRIGITVSKKVGNAVARNRIKRLVKEYFRHRKDFVYGTNDISVIGRKGLTKLSNKQINKKLDKLFEKIASA